MVLMSLWGKYLLLVLFSHTTRFLDHRQDCLCRHLWVFVHNRYLDIILVFYSFHCISLKSWRSEYCVAYPKSQYYPAELGIICQTLVLKLSSGSPCCSLAMLLGRLLLGSYVAECYMEGNCNFLPELEPPSRWQD